MHDADALIRNPDQSCNTRWAIGIAVCALAACAPEAVATQEGVPVAIGLPQGVEVFSDPMTGCEYFYTVIGSAITVSPRYEGGARNSSGSDLTRVKGCRS